MSAPVPAAQCSQPECHGNPFRYCPACDWVEPAPAAPELHLGELVEVQREPNLTVHIDVAEILRQCRTRADAAEFIGWVVAHVRGGAS